MYIQLTTRCNLKCPHCCMNAKKRGEDMDLEIFRAACIAARETGSNICLGGGEPTLHPKFWEFFGLALGSADEDLGVWISTNGTQTEIAVALAGLAKRGVLTAQLSLGEYHGGEETVDPRVIKAWGFSSYWDAVRHDGHRAHVDVATGRLLDDHRNVRVDDEECVLPAGRGAKLLGEPANPRSKRWSCPCDELTVRPDGSVYACGCLDARPLGSVLSDNICDVIAALADVGSELNEQCDKELDDDMVEKIRTAGAVVH